MDAPADILASVRVALSRADADGEPTSLSLALILYAAVAEAFVDDYPEVDSQLNPIATAGTMNRAPGVTPERAESDLHARALCVRIDQLARPEPFSRTLHPPAPSDPRLL